MVNVGVIGLGMMGLTHLDAYKKRDDVKVVAIADKDPDRLSGKVRAVGNVEGQAQDGVGSMDVKRYTEGEDLIADPDVHMVDVCLPTHMHLMYAMKVLESGKHMMMEKPLARTADDAEKIVEAAENAQGLSFVGMCMRFWPGWTWLKDAIDNNTYGKTLSATFRRVASHPGGPFYSNGEKCGGALLDLHIHDVDFVQYCFGMPQAVQTVGYKKVTSEWDHVITRYEFDGDDAPVVMAEGCWCMSPGFPFSMAFTVNFENATAVFDMSKDKPLTVYRPDVDPETIDPGNAAGYDLEIAYFIECIKENRKPVTVTLRDAANTIRICEAEAQSAASGQSVLLK